MISNLGPYPAYRPSGVPWLGDVPAHWEVRRLGTSVQGCINGSWGSEPNGRDDLPCVRVADFDRERLRVRLANPTIRAIAPSERSRRLLKNGDLLLFAAQEVQVVPATRQLWEDTARLRAATGLKTPDALHAVTALRAECMLFITNDAGFRRVQGLPVTVLDDVLAE